MKNLLLFILILLNSSVFACGFYPFGEETRFSIINPRFFDFMDYAEFYYSVNSFTPSNGSTSEPFTDENTELWYRYCNHKVDHSAIEAAVYNLLEDEVNASSSNAMIKYLYLKKDKEALNYLRFAKKCEFYNSLVSDPWEKNAVASLPGRREIIDQAIKFSNTVKSKELKRRYTFLAIRMSWYGHDYKKIRLLFREVFQKSKKRDILYYWSLYFKSTTNRDPAFSNYELAQVFSNAVDKRFVCHQSYKKSIPVSRVLRYAKTSQQRANVYLLAGIEKYEKGLFELTNLYKNNPASEGLTFLLMREINKIEDYVFTPYYTLFQPPLSYDYWAEEDVYTSVRQSLRRSEEDRKYAKDVLSFVQRADLKKVKNPYFWKFCKAYLSFVTRDYTASISILQKLEKSAPSTTILNQIQIIKSLALVAKQKKGKAVIPKAIRSVILKNQYNNKFLFAIGKELEYLGNTTDAALLYSKLQENYDYTEEEENAPNSVYWKSIKNKRRTFSSYFISYFSYIDAVYTPEQIQHLIHNIDKHSSQTDTFSVFKYSECRDKLPLLYDLLGTKYIRQNKLSSALAAFEKTGPEYDQDAYSPWTNGGYVFSENPFFNLKYTPVFAVPDEPMRISKYSITKQLIKYLKIAENPKEPNRDYYYFLVANAYYNMGWDGNAKMMRRMDYQYLDYISIIDDEREYKETNIAKEYYLKALEQAKTRKFKALCMRMAARCHRNKLYFKANWEKSYSLDDSYMENNPYLKKLKSNYPDCYSDLSSNCECFEEYFAARR